MYVCMYIYIYFNLNVLTLRDPKNMRMLTESNMAPVTPLAITTVGIRGINY
jgi:hypothetical protein